MILSKPKTEAICIKEAGANLPRLKHLTVNYLSRINFFVSLKLPEVRV